MMAKLNDIRKRDELPEPYKALSDTLDEYLHRIYGIVTGWTNPVMFRVWLNENGLDITSIQNDTDT